MLGSAISTWKFTVVVVLGVHVLAVFVDALRLSPLALSCVLGSHRPWPADFKFIEFDSGCGAVCVVCVWEPAQPMEIR